MVNSSTCLQNISGADIVSDHSLVMCKLIGADHTLLAQLVATKTLA